MKRGASSRLTGTTSLGFLVLTCLSACGSTEPQTLPGGAGTGGVGGQAGGTGGVMSGGSAGTGGSAGGSGGTSGAGGAGGTSGAGGSAGSSSVTTCSKPSDAGPLTTRLPCLLSETGLYEADMVTLSAGVHTYAPSFQLWSDAAEKKRWISLPADTQIDTTDMDFWEFPAGTKLWKEFARDGVRVETRLIQKQPSGSWYAVAYHWRSDQMEADAVPNGVQNASSTPHDIPDNEACMKCHSQQPDKVLGFSAIQLSHATVNAADPREWTLSTLVADDVLTAPPARAFTVPGTQTEKDFFGYLHANCGHCHNPTGSGNSQTGLDMWLKVADLAGPVTEFSVYKALYDVDIVWLDGAHPAGTKRVVPGNFADSAIYQRLMTKGEEWSMPPLATEEVDPTAKQIFETWIGSLAQP